MARNDPQVNIRLPLELKERLERAAEENNRAFKAEIVGRLENSFDAPEGYQELAELAIAAMKESADSARREVEEYREMVGTIRLFRHIVDRLVVQAGETLPTDLRTIVSLLNPSSSERTDEELLEILEALQTAHERREAIIAEQEKRPPETSFEDRLTRVQAFLQRKQAKQGKLSPPEPT